MDLNVKRRARERLIAAEIANELFAALKAIMDAGTTPQRLIDEHRGLMAHVFALGCERHQLSTKPEMERVFAYIIPALADARRNAERIAREVDRLAARAEALRR